MARADDLIYMPPLPRHFKKYALAQIAVLAVVVYVWYIINGGFIPQFLLPGLPYFNVGPDIGTLTFFTVEGDASKIKWARETNSRQGVKAAMGDPGVHMLEGDVILRGQGTKHQILEPVMAKPPQTDSEITLKEWLQEIRFGSKGIKLHFHSVEAVEISLEILNDFNKQNPIKFPVWIHADVLQGPHGDAPVINFIRFIRTLQRLFPKCTLSLGWTTGTHTDLSQSAYTWDSVLDMREILQELEIKDQQIVFQARLSLIHNSIPQLKWLCDNVKDSSLMIWHENGDEVVSEDVMYVAYRFPPHGVYFDLNHEDFSKLLQQYRHFSRDRVESLVLKRDEVVFKPGGWLKMGFWKQKNSVMGSTEAIILSGPIAYIVTKTKYRPTPEIYIQGRLQFLNRDDRNAEDFRTGLGIYLRVTEYEMFDNIVGIRCFIGAGGEIEVAGAHLPSKMESFRKTSRLTPTSANCFRFRITDEKDKIVFAVKSLHECITLDSVEDEEELTALLTVSIPTSVRLSTQSPFLIKMEDNNRQVIIDELSIRHK